MNSSSSTEFYGENLVLNGDFNGSASGWTLSGGAYYSSGKVVIPSSGMPFKTLSQYVPDITPGRKYYVAYTLTGTAGTVSSSVQLGGTGFSYGTSTGRLTRILQPDSEGQIRITVETFGTGAAEVDDVVVQELMESSWSSQSSESTPSGSSLSSISSNNSSSSVTISTSSSVSSSQTDDLSSVSSPSSASSTSFGLSVSSSSDSSSSLSSSSPSSVNSSSSSVSSPSSSSLSSPSSSSSGNDGHMELLFSIEGVENHPVWCFARRNESVFAGTGPYGEVIRSVDGRAWEAFVEVGDSHVRSLAVYANGLWIGTEPHGYIYVHNFSSGSFYKFVETEDHAVTCFAEHNGKLYAGTSPAGVIYSFDGFGWSREKELYGGVNSMFSFGNDLYVAMSNTEVVVKYNGTTWSSVAISTPVIGDDLPTLVGSPPLSGGKQSDTASSFRALSTEPFSTDKAGFIRRDKLGDVAGAAASGEISGNDAAAVSPPSPEYDITAIGSYDGKIVFGGGATGVVLSLSDDGKASRLHQAGGEQIVGIAGGTGMFATKNTVYILT